MARVAEEEVASVSLMPLAAGPGKPAVSETDRHRELQPSPGQQRNWRRSDFHGIHMPLFRITPTL